MTLQAVIARPLMDLAAALTPASRAEWSLAMRQEFEALPDGQGGLGWATGCLANALGWRIRAEAPFGFTLAALILGGSWVNGQIFFALVDTLTPRGLSWMSVMAVTTPLLQASLCFGVALFWPRRAVWTGALFPFAFAMGAMPQFFLIILNHALQAPWTAVGNHPALPNILFPFLFVAQEMWPSALGAALGWGASRLWPARRPIAA